MDYTETLNLPKTDYPMRAGLPQREPEYLQKCADDMLYEKILEKNADKPSYILHDGPPYANGDIHLGHALNKILKDFIIRYKNMSGFRAPLVHGWDTHGLPIELQAIKKVGIDRSKVGVLDFRKQCKEFALSYVDNQRKQFKRLGVLGDFDNPYLTVNKDFEAKQIEVFGEMAKKGYIYKGLKPVYWCPHDETALAEAEIEYADSKCTSIYVKFAVKDDKGLFEGLENVFFVIWTTTPWTLPGNTAICLNPDFDYVLVKVKDEYLIVADELCENVMQAAGYENYEKIKTFTGKQLEYIECRNPLFDRKSLVILGDHVTLETGSGCVHTAPGYGMEDYQVSLKYKDVDIIVAVDSKGVMTKEAGQFKGLFYEKSNSVIVDTLKQSGALIASEEMVHSYPHCWRCKNPVIFRATEQWFCSIDKFREQAIEAVRGVNWKPEWGKERLISMIRDRNDWCISRQRIWGVPIPIFYCAECGKPIINDESIKIVSDLFRKEGSDAWWKYSADEILAGKLKCECGCGQFTKETDIMDVWFDSGSSSQAVLRQRDGLSFPADTYLEGVDQFRGWFQSSLLISVAVTGIAPYKNVYAHGFTIDGEGKKMSKSLGNTISPIDVVNQYGADILRLWVSATEYTTDLSLSQDILKQLSEIYRKIRNTARFILGNIADFDPTTDRVEYSKLSKTDKWALYKLNELIDKVTQSFEKCEFHTIFHAIHNFCVIDMSNIYLDIIKDTLYVEDKNCPARRAAQTTIYTILNVLTRMLAPILFFTSDEIWQQLKHSSDQNSQNVMLNDFPESKKEWNNTEISEEFEKILSVRDEVKKNLEQARVSKVIGASLEAKITLTVCKDDFDFFNERKDLLKFLFIVSQLDIYSGECLEVKVEKASGGKCERCWSYSDTVGKNTDTPTLCSRCSDIVKNCL